VEPTDGQNAGNLRTAKVETVMLRQQPRIISDLAKAPASSPHTGDWHDVIGHHRYYGSSAIQGERITETRSGAQPHSLNVCGF
jgi:hypothetical protein